MFSFAPFHMAWKCKNPAFPFRGRGTAAAVDEVRCPQGWREFIVHCTIMIYREGGPPQRWMRFAPFAAAKEKDGDRTQPKVCLPSPFPFHTGTETYLFSASHSSALAAETRLMVSSA